MSRRKKRRSIPDLTWDDLEEWAGKKIVSRGRSYRSAVDDLRRTPNGHLLAWVSGTRRYATLAGIDDESELESSCTCPYDWGPCKHAVAVLLSFLDTVKRGASVSEASDDDERLRLLSDEVPDDLIEDEEDNWDGEDDAFVEEGYRGRGADEAMTPEAKGPADRGERKRSRNLEEYLTEHSKKALVDLLLELASKHSIVHEAISDRAQLAGGHVGAHDKKVGYAIFLFFCPGNCSIAYYITSGRSP